MKSSDTIVAPATPPGQGGLAVIRLSGPGAEKELLGCFQPRRSIPRIETHRLYYGSVTDGNRRLLDQVLAVVMRGPHSYTGEDVAEIHCHGGPVIVRQILDLLLESDVRLAEPGEFTQRAFLNGRLDLAQAEAVAALIAAQTDQAARIALNQLDGRLSGLLARFRQQLIEQLALLETHVDFNDEDISLPDLQGVAAQVEGLRLELGELLESFDTGRLLQDGVRVLLLGKPNVGKSSLLNHLLGEPRAIVTEQPGTTRDIIEENLLLGGLPVRLIDTAGVRRSTDLIEQEGVRRAEEKVKSADLVLLMVDGSAPLDRDDLSALQACEGKNVLLVVNKRDLGSIPLPDTYRGLPQIAVSVSEELGLDLLEQRVRKMLVPEGACSAAGQTVMLYERRHRQALTQSASALERFSRGLVEALPVEILALELRDALSFVGLVTGETTPDQILDEIFSRFCIGK